MINFEIRLSFQACQILFWLIEWTEIRDAGLEYPKGKTKWEVEHEAFCAVVFRQEPMSHFVTHARILEREGLITKKKNLSDATITRKGFLLAEILRIEFEQAKKASLQSPERKLIKSPKRQENLHAFKDPKGKWKSK